MPLIEMQVVHVSETWNTGHTLNFINVLILRCFDKNTFTLVYVC